MRKVDWARVGRVTEPGRYMMRFGYVIVTADDLEIPGKNIRKRHSRWCRCSLRAPRRSTGSAPLMCRRTGMSRTLYSGAPHVPGRLSGGQLCSSIHGQITAPRPILRAIFATCPAVLLNWVFSNNG